MPGSRGWGQSPDDLLIASASLEQGGLGEFGPDELHADGQAVGPLPQGDVKGQGRPAMLTLMVQMSAAYIFKGSSTFSPILKAVEGCGG